MIVDRAIIIKTHTQVVILFKQGVQFSGAFRILHEHGIYCSHYEVKVGHPVEVECLIPKDVVDERISKLFECKHIQTITKCY